MAIVKQDPCHDGAPHPQAPADDLPKHGAVQPVRCTSEVRTTDPTVVVSR
jgi:hypothetical protein